MNKSLTKNDGITNQSSLDSVVDLFFVIGASRNNEDLLPMFEKAFQQDQDLTMRTLAWVRDIRGGAGERETTRKLMQYLEQNHPDVLEKFLPHIPELGRWDDLLVVQTDRFFDQVSDMIKTALQNGDGLCAKWMPREKSAKKALASKLRQSLGLSQRQYRKTLSQLTQVVENQMCAKNWDGVNYSHVPSVASAQYRKAFFKHDADRYSAWIDELSKPEDQRDPDVKVNAGAIFPHDVLREVIDGMNIGRCYGFRNNTTLTDPMVKAAQVQWDALPNFMKEKTILPMIDISGSMYVGISGNLTAMQVAVSLGMYVANKTETTFKNIVMPFSNYPELVKIRDGVLNGLQDIKNLDIDYGGTNIDAAFKLILEHAIQHKVPQKDMPQMLLVLSDMEFNSCGTMTQYEKLKKDFVNAGYEIPQVVFWNLNGRSGNCPVTITDNGTALISGYSPSILKSLMEGNVITPKDVMMNTLMKPRYQIL